MRCTDLIFSHDENDCSKSQPVRKCTTGHADVPAGPGAKQCCQRTPLYHNYKVRGCRNDTSEQNTTQKKPNKNRSNTTIVFQFPKLANKKIKRNLA